MEKCEKIQLLADQSRLDLINISENIKDSIHWGSTFSLMEVMAVFFSEVYRKEKDTFILSKGHAASGIYAILHRLGVISDDLWMSYRKDGSPLTELMEFNRELGFGCSGGSLGLGPSYGEGIALLNNKMKNDGKVYVVIGDGEANEGSVWEALASIGHYCLQNFTLIIDRNRLQSDGDTELVLKLPDFTEIISKFGWKTYDINGHDCEVILQTFVESQQNNMPTVIVCNTIKGKGVSFMEGEAVWHDKGMTKTEFEQARKEVADRVAI